MRLARILLSALLFISAVNAYGDGTAFYASVGVGHSSTNDTAQAENGLTFTEPMEFVPGVLLPDIEIAGIDGVRFDDDDISWTVALGFQFNRYASIQIGYLDIGEFNTLKSNTGRPFDEVSLSAVEYSLSGKFSYPIYERLKLIGLLGVTRTSFDATGVVTVFLGPEDLSFVTSDRETADAPASETGFSFGAGFDWKISSSLSLQISFVRHSTQVIDIDTTCIELIYGL